MPDYKYDFAKIKADYPIADVAERLGLKLKREGQQLRGACPSGQGGDRALAITPEKGVFFSQAAKVGGSVIDLVMFVNKVDRTAACAWITGTATAPEKSVDGRTTNAEFKPVELTHDHPSVLISGIEEVDARRFGLGFREPAEGKKRAGEGHILIPVYASGKLAGYVGVAEITWLPDKWRA